ncbi:uncharacterized protein CIMG_00691 [Coccidioides immitis RS]|uniref:Uncharacterized protein n=2 Tax=Coccidioides immitis TaxID=5501 RepID=A0A0E1RZZ6_COCIM|nr:uncharacterized protein CIMG_00691 [Coccidioides immitis RS]EAS35337.2 hypothetical protein CIMG_00691 [Coccidioides immitis RS]KMP00588.1 hypothetical protein CIRG_00730 [Coccidioides immitis RMSCC 2394]TPX26380.1 hypothetical protein DIZ76_011842 [Coccidioides immitis]
MDLSELKDDLYDLYRNRSSYWVRDIPYFKSSCSKILWKLGPVFTERETYGDDDIYKTYITETCGTCVATQVEGPSPGVQGIAKIRLQIPDDPENPSSTKPQRSSSRLAFEYYNHRTLTELGCTCIPKLLDYTLFTQKKGDPLPGGFLFILVMERLPGRNLVNFADLPMSERDQVRLAFAKSIREFYAFRFMHNDPDRRNLMWDPENKKCYIIDLEDAYQINDDEEPTKFMPEIHYREWGIAGPEINCHMYGLDPMVPHDRKFIKDPDDKTLERMAADSAGNQLVFGK